MAASATFALKPGVWFRRGRLLMVSPDKMGTACPLSGRNSTYRPVQISGTGSHLDHRSGLDRQDQIETGNDEGEDQELEAGEARFGHVLFACRELRLGDEIGEVELPVPYLPDDRQAEEQNDGGHHAGDDK